VEEGGRGYAWVMQEPLPGGMSRSYAESIVEGREEQREHQDNGMSQKPVYMKTVCKTPKTRCLVTTVFFFPRSLKVSPPSS
jgi:hypothetical protein